MRHAARAAVFSSTLPSRSVFVRGYDAKGSVDINENKNNITFFFLTAESPALLRCIHPKFLTSSVKIVMLIRNLRVRSTVGWLQPASLRSIREYQAKILARDYCKLQTGSTSYDTTYLLLA